MTALVLIGRPKSLHIPAMAMNAPSSRESRWSYGRIDRAQLASRCKQWISTTQHHIRLVHTRNYLPRQTAFYAEWLMFPSDEAAAELLDAFPALQIGHRLQRLQEERRVTAERMEQRLGRGGFDIGKHPVEQRRAIAQRYIEFDDAIRDIDEHHRALKLAQQLGDEWESRWTSTI